LDETKDQKYDADNVCKIPEESQGRVERLLAKSEPAATPRLGLSIGTSIILAIARKIAAKPKGYTDRKYFFLFNRQ
jgi:hypothetical protein